MSSKRKHPFVQGGKRKGKKKQAKKVRGDIDLNSPQVGDILCTDYKKKISDRQ